MDAIGKRGPGMDKEEIGCAVYREGQTDVEPDPEPIELMERLPLVSLDAASDPFQLHRKQWRPRAITRGGWSGVSCRGVGRGGSC